MFDVGLQELIVIGVLALLVFGPSKLPELGRMFGRAMREFKRASDEFRSTVETNLQIHEEPEPLITPSAADTASSGTSSETLPSEAETTPAESPSSTAVALAEEPFCAQRGSRLFHRSACEWTRRIPSGERLEFAHIADARAQGFVSCPVCEPWEPV